MKICVNVTQLDKLLSFEELRKNLAEQNSNWLSRRGMARKGGHHFIDCYARLKT
jgi:hypothetical protein